MKYIMIYLLLFAQVSFAAVKWDAQEVNTAYKLNQDIVLQMDDQKYNIPKGTQFDLNEVSDLNMIKVHLHKYKINNCPSPNVETDLQLISIRQNNRRKTSVGVNLTRNCIVEIFVDMKEYATFSFLD